MAVKQLIERIEVGAGGAASIEFTSIPQDGTDLVVKMSLRGSQATDATGIFFNFNNDTSANYDRVYLRGSGSSVNTSSSTSDTTFFTNGNGSTSTSNTFTSAELYISNYASSNNKSISLNSTMENNATLAYQMINAISWNNSAAMTSIQIDAQVSFVEYSTASLYKITRGGDGTVTTA